MTWDPFGTIANTLWLGGGQWAGKSTVARILAGRCGITAYHYDYHDARGHDARRIAGRATRGEPLTGPDPDEMWVRRTPGDMAEDALAEFGRRFEWTLDDLRGLVSGRPILAEGWGLRPELVAPLLESPGRMLVMVPTEEFRQRQLRDLPRAREFGLHVSDPRRAQANRVDRDRLLAESAAEAARERGIRVMGVDGSRDAEQVATEVADHFAPYLG
ncbi:hypothetical protein [Actinopolymorpha rutila]|uniref:Adenylate kinase n=1 Tax=Actinopolymorpha rutila TaxID=446787 RepID=A0A852ZA33_9ACTN|nr:hypothetical protein [Actinopolymorpha rutila]NYH89871.1 hypothetical protein [Actinopolymorpha rutila]